MLLNRLSTEKNRCITLLGIHRSMILNIFYSSPRKKEKKTIWQQKINRNKSDWKKKKKRQYKIPPFSSSANLGENSIEFYNNEDCKRQSVIKQF